MTPAFRLSRIFAMLTLATFGVPASAQVYSFTTLAGAVGTSGSADGIGSAARFKSPFGVAVDSSGIVFVADFYNHTIRKITASGVVTTLAGAPGLVGSADGVGATARFNFPGGVAVDRIGNLFVTDSGNDTIRKIDPNGIVTTIAGLTGVPGIADGVATAARFNTPRGIAIDRDGNLFIADKGALRKFATSGSVTTLTLTNIDGSTRSPTTQGVAVDAAGTVYFTDINRIRKITADGVIVTLAGSDPIFDRLGTDVSTGRVDGPGNIARFFAPNGLAVDQAGNVFVTDWAVREIAPNGFVITVGGNSGGGADGTGVFAGFDQAAAVAVDAGGTLFVADGNDTIRKGVPAVVPGRLTNFSALAFLTGGDTLTMGETIGGAGTSGAKLMLARAVGPSLAPFGITGFLADPRIAFYLGSTKIIEDDDWDGGGDQVAMVGAFPFVAPSSKDASLFLQVLAGSSTLRVSGNGNAGGTVLAELYDTTPVGVFNPTTPRLLNASVLTNVGSGVTVGFMVGGTVPMRLLVRAVGPSLAPFGVNGLLADPKLELFDGQSHSIATNDSWGDDTSLASAFARVGAFMFLGSTSKDAALLVTLAPGAYTMQVRSVDTTTGVALVEVYEEP